MPYKKHHNLRYISLNDPNKHLRFIIYYKKFQTSKLIITKNTRPHKSPLFKNNDVYEFSCSLADYISNTNNKHYKKNIKYLYWALMNQTLWQIDLSSVKTQCNPYTHRERLKCNYKHILVDNAK